MREASGKNYSQRPDPQRGRGCPQRADRHNRISIVTRSGVSAAGKLLAMRIRSAGWLPRSRSHRRRAFVGLISAVKVAYPVADELTAEAQRLGLDY